MSALLLPWSAVKSLSSDHPNCVPVSLFGSCYGANQEVTSKRKARCEFRGDFLRRAFHISMTAETMPRLGSSSPR